MRERSAIATANSIRLHRQLHSGAFLVVEGRADRLFFQRFVAGEHCVLTVAGGRDLVAEVVEILVGSRFEGVVGVVDGDGVRAGIRGNENLFLLDDADLEVMLIRSNALEKVLVEFGSRTKLGKLSADVREILIEAARPIGCFRIYSRDAGLGLKFDAIRYSKFIDLRSLKLDRHALIHEVKRRSQRGGLDCGTMLEEVRSSEGGLAGTWGLCCGDDLVWILGLGLRRLFGTNAGRRVSHEILTQSLRLAYGDSDFEGTGVYKELHEWARRNAGFRVL